MALQLATITNAIAALTVPGVGIRDIDEIPVGLTVRDTPVLLPDPNGLLTNFAVKIDSFGMSAERRYTVTYDLNYLLVGSMVGIDRATVLGWYASLYDHALDVIDVVLASDVTGAADLVVKTVSKPLGLVDASNNRVNGILITFAVKELVN